MANHHNRHRETLSSIASSSTSPSPPSTPPRRDRKYPHHLARGDPGHVPLHRRETADKYERLEDLLREAGYKETRIFTPEADKFPAADDRRGKPTGEADAGIIRGGVDSVVGFLAGLIPGTTKPDVPESDAAGSSIDTSTASSSESPLAYKESLTNKSSAKKFSISPTPSTTNLASSNPSSDGSCGSQRLNYNKRLNSLRTNQLSIRTQTPFSSNPSAARALLRHMASTPDIPKTQGSTSSVHGTGLADQHPPLPTTWLDIVKQAVSSSSVVGVHTGGPEEHLSKTMKTQRKKESNPASHHHTDNHRGRPTTRDNVVHLAPQPFTLRAASPGPVSMVSVVCKSAPGSRSSSVVRGSFRGGILDIGRLDRELIGKGKERGRGQLRPPQDQRDGVPTLVAARVDDDLWGGVNSSKEPYDDYYDDEEEEGELDLARLLVPPKRQRSIRSLRRHLDKHSTLDGKTGGVAGLEVWRPEHDSGYGSFLKHGQRRRGSLDDIDVKDWRLSSLTFPNTRRRSGIPSNWVDE